MMHKLYRLVLAFVSLAACQLTSGDTDGDNGDAADADNGVEGSNEDPNNCGELGLNCVGPLGIGECVGGECQGRLTDCTLGAGTCDMVCQNYGATCAERDCDGATAWVWNAPSQEEADSLCAIGDKQSVESLAIGCGEQLNGQAMSVNCCCKW